MPKATRLVMDGAKQGAEMEIIEKGKGKLYRVVTKESYFLLKLAYCSRVKHPMEL